MPAGPLWQNAKEDPAAVGCLYGIGGVPGAGTGSGHAEHQRREEPAVDGVLPDLIRLCQVHPEGTRLCEGHGDLGGRRAGGDGMHRGRDPVGISKQKQSGGEQSEHIRIR